jgi:hypothetical protein
VGPRGAGVKARDSQTTVIAVGSGDASLSEVAG